MFCGVVFPVADEGASPGQCGTNAQSGSSSGRTIRFSSQPTTQEYHQPQGNQPTASPVPSDISSIRISTRIPTSSSNQVNGQEQRQHAFLEPTGVPIKQEWSQQNGCRTLPPLAPGPGSHAGSDVGDQQLMLPPGSALSHYASSFNSLSPFPVEISPSGSSFASPRHSARSHSAKSRKRALSLSPLSAEGIDLNSLIRTSPTSLVAFINNSRGGSSGSISPAVGLHSGDYGHLSARNSGSPMSNVSFGHQPNFLTGAVTSTGSSPPPPPYQPPKMVTCGFRDNTFQEDTTSSQMAQQQMQQLEQTAAVTSATMDNMPPLQQAVPPQSQLIVQTREKALEEFTTFNNEYQQQQELKQEPMDTFQSAGAFPQTNLDFASQQNSTFPPVETSYNSTFVDAPVEYSQAQMTYSQPNTNFTDGYPLPPAYSNHTPTAPFQPTSMPPPSMPPPSMPPPSMPPPHMSGHPSLPANMPSLPTNMPPPPPYGQHIDSAATHSPPIATSQQNSPATKTENENERVNICKWIDCNAVFEEQEDLVRHIEKVHIDQRKGEDFTCFWQGCTRRYKPFNARYKLLIHMRVHSGEKPNKCTVSSTFILICDNSKKLKQVFIAKSK